jgi:hypothetical protein
VKVIIVGCLLKEATPPSSINYATGGVLHPSWLYFE